MTSSNAHPRWWQLYLTCPLLLALFVLDHRLKIPTRGHQAVQIAIVVLVYGLIHLWLKTNAKALSGVDQRQYYGTFKVVRILPYQVSAPDNDKQSMIQLPHSEIKAMLSDSIEMDTIDAKLLPIDTVSEKLNKE